ncbi:hypothetical protein [Bacteroides gallinarum]|uniref:hypothetical protein n=1 Tax=Bacteroides gallinarum TaxID=376806 RepID=UPI00037D4632|nr:hypothetical protein [Bacteroides gallinarum]
MSNENSNLRVGSAGAGLFVGSSQIMAGGVANLLKEITIAPDFNAYNTTSVLVANLSSKELTLTRNDDVTIIPKQHIQWYSYSVNTHVKLQSNEDIYILTILYMGETTGYDKKIGTNLIDITTPMNIGFYLAFIIFDKI